jgi:hypothetical protein
MALAVIEGVPRALAKAVPVTLTEIFVPVWTVTVPTEDVSDVPERLRIASAVRLRVPTAEESAVPEELTEAEAVSVTVPRALAMETPVSTTDASDVPAGAKEADG